ncbi:Arylsulfatase [Neorhodopirellula pilleata]|uniref:Arylsulfatase n=2 Tax=Neorhodopirellula pilleata TaxID=2714738 RepID=A0A5C6AD60_9BACT|nr:Arylsulfatase [Neorhodopirellula pilleata]
MRITLTLTCFLLMATSAIAARPNILFIVCDDLNTHVSTSGYPDIQTPTFEALAKDGMTFSRAFCQYPVCGPSRASFLSGLYPESTGVLDNKSDIRQTRPNTVSMPQYFKDNGYWTASIGKVFHNEKADHGDVAWSDAPPWFENDELPVVTEARNKFEQEYGSVEKAANRPKWRAAMKAVLDPLNAQTPPGHGPSGLRDEQHSDGKNARQVINWLKRKSHGDKPFFIALGIHKPHVPFLAPDKYFDLYPREQIQFHRDRADLWNSIPRDASANRFKEFDFELGVENEPRRREFMQAYHACVSFIDAQIGLVLQTLKDESLYDNTIIVLTSDHGYHLGDHFLWGKVTLFDIGAKVPLIVRVPGVTSAGSHSDAMVELVDVFPTLTQLAGLEMPQHLQGTSIAPILQDPSRKHAKDYAYSVVSRGPNLGFAVRNQNWRYGKWPSGEELYDLNKDPHERNNVANDSRFAERLKELRAVLAEKQNMARSQRESPTVSDD